MTDEKIQAAQAFIEQTHRDATLRAKLGNLGQGDYAAVWQIAAEAGYQIDYDAFLAACRSASVTMLPLELERVIAPLQRLKWSLGDDQAQGFQPTHARSSDRQKPDLNLTLPPEQRLSIHEEPSKELVSHEAPPKAMIEHEPPPKDVLRVASVETDLPKDVDATDDTDHQKPVEAAQTQIKSPLEPSILQQAQALTNQLATDDAPTSLPKIKTLPPQANVPDTVAFIQMVDQSEALQAALKTLERHDFDGAWSLAAEMGYHVNMGTVSEACLSKKITRFHPDLARVIGNYFYWIK